MKTVGFKIGPYPIWDCCTQEGCTPCLSKVPPVGAVHAARLPRDDVVVGLPCDGGHVLKAENFAGPGEMARGRQLQQQKAEKGKGFHPGWLSTADCRCWRIIGPKTECDLWRGEKGRNGSVCRRV